MDQSFLEQVKVFGIEWSGVFTILFMFLIVYFLWKTVKLMPKTKPVQIKPDMKSSISWDEIAGVDESKEELQEVVEFLRDPKRFQGARRARAQGRAAARASGHRQDAARQGRRGSDISGEREQTLNQLLVEMDGFDTSGDLVVMTRIAT